MNVTKILNNLQNTAESIRATRRALHDDGVSDEQVNTMIFLELGGDCIVIVGDDGVARYESSGVAVDSINWPPEDLEDDEDE